MEQRPPPSVLDKVREDTELLSGVVKKAIRVRYGEFFEKNFGLVRDMEPYRDSIFYSLYREAFDRGLGSKRTYRSISDKKEHVAHPLAMLKRSSAMALVNERVIPADEYARTPLQIVYLDIASFAKANLLSKTAGDYLANKAAGALQKALEETKREFGRELQESGSDSLDFRYGGDEFMIAVMGKAPSGFIQKLQENIRTKMDEERGFFSDANGKENELPIKLKDLGVIEIPRNQYEQQVFFTYLRRGIILNHRALEKIMKIFNTVDGFNEQLFLKFLQRSKVKDVEYPEEVKTIEQKAQYLAAIHPEYVSALWLAQEQDRIALKADIVQGALKSVVGFIEDSVYNRLFKNNVKSFDHLMDFLVQKRQYPVDIETSPEHADRLICLAFNGLKDINDGVNLAVGDLALEAIGEAINFKTDNGESFLNDRKHTNLHQRGGTMVVTVDKRRLDDENYKKLMNLKSIRFQSYDGTWIELPIGVIEKRLYVEPIRGMAEDLARELLNGSLQSADDQYYINQIGRMNNTSLLLELEYWASKPPEEIKRFLQIFEDNSELSERALYLRHFLHEKNTIERCGRAIHALHTADGEAIADRKRWIKVFQKISDNWKIQRESSE